MATIATMGTRRARSLALVLGLAASGAACGDDDVADVADETAADTAGDAVEDTAGASLPASTAAGTTAAAASTPAGGSVSAVTVTVTDAGVELPDEIAAGAVQVTLDGAQDEVDFSRVEEGTTEEAFIDGMAAILEGGPAPQFLLGNAGVGVGEEPSTILLEPGSYIVWTESGVADGLAPEGTPIMFTAPTTVTGDGGGELPPTDGTITARDHAFDLDVSAGDTFTFVNDGPDQLHHALIFSFGDLDPGVVEENFPILMETGEPPPAFAELDLESIEAGGSGVFSAGGAGTFSATLEAGGTYVVACFLSDLEGGPPHAVANGMWQVFTVE